MNTRNLTRALLIVGVLGFLLYSAGQMVNSLAASVGQRGVGSISMNK